MRILIPLALLSSALISNAAQAITIPPEALPGAIATCSNCIVLPNSTTDFGYMSVFTLARLDNFGGATLTNLVRYTLDPASAIHTEGDYGDGPYATHDNYTGYIWMEAPQIIQDNNAVFNIFTDQITPVAEPYQEYQNNTWTFSMDLQSAINGSASAYLTGWPDYTTAGNLNILDGMLLCIECGANVTLNLIGLSYLQDGSSVINASDSRALLLGYTDYWDFRNTTRNFYVQAVPVPAAAGLLISGLIALSCFRRREFR